MSLSAVQGMFSTMEALRQQRKGVFDDEQARKKAAREDEDREFELGERKRALETRAELDREGAPLPVDEPDIAGPVMPGAEGPAGKALGTDIQVSGKSFATREDADKFANDPHAATMRQAAVLARKGNPEGASKIRAGSMTEQVAGLKLSEAQRDDVVARYQHDLQQKVPAGDWDAMSRFASDSKMDGADGQVKYDWKLSGDGTKRELHVQIPGKPWSPTGTATDNTPEGFNEQLMHLSHVPPEKMALHFDRKAQRAELKRYHDELLKDKDEARDQRRLEFEARMSYLKGGGARGARGGDDADPPDTIDMGAIDKVVDDYLSAKDENGKLVMPADPALRARVRALAAKSPEALGGDPQGAAMLAVQIYQDAMKMAGGDLRKADLLVVAQRDQRENPTPGGYTVLSSSDNKLMTIGKPEAANVPPGGGKGPAPTGAMAQLMAQDAAKAQAEKEARAKAAAERQASVQAAQALTLEQINSLSPLEALRLLNSPAGQRLDPRVRTLLQGQAAPVDPTRFNRFR